METELKDLLAYLYDLYAAQPKDHGDKVALHAEPFVAFARSFLAAHRLQGIFPVDDNYGLILGNQERVVVCPAGEAVQHDEVNNVDTSGTMRVTSRG